MSCQYDLGLGPIVDIGQRFALKTTRLVNNPVREIAYVALQEPDQGVLLVQSSDGGSFQVVAYKDESQSVLYRRVIQIILYEVR